MSSSLRVHIVTAHPDPASLTRSVCRAIADCVRAAGAHATVHDLTEVGFDPTWTAEDMDAYRRRFAGETVEPPPDVLREQAAVASSDVLVIVFPVHWWSLPAQLKGWFDRVFTGGWAWGSSSWRAEQGSAVANVVPHVVALTGTPQEAFDRHGYLTAMRTQIDHGILQYNNFQPARWTWVWDVREVTAAEQLETAVSEVVRALPL